MAEDDREKKKGLTEKHLALGCVVYFILFFGLGSLYDDCSSGTGGSGWDEEPLCPRCP